MAKQKITVKIAGKDFTISSEESEEYIQRIAGYVNTRMNELSAISSLNDTQLAILTAINAADDMMKSREEIRRLRKELMDIQAELEAVKNSLRDPSADNGYENQ